MPPENAPSHPAPMPFHIKLGIFIFASAILPILTLGLITLNLSSKAIDKLVVKNHQSELKIIENGLNVYLNSQLDHLKAFSRLPELQSFAQNEIEAPGLNFLVNNTFFREILVFDKNFQLMGAAGRHTGQTLARLLGKPVSSLEIKQFRGLAPAFEKIRQSFATGEKNSFSFLNSGVNHLFIIPIRHFSQPSEFAGICLATAILSGSQIQSLLDSSSEDEQTYACIFNQQGEIIARKGDRLSLRAIKFDIDRDQLGVDPEINFKTIKVANGNESDLLSFSYNRFLDSFVAVGQASKSAFRLIDEIRENFISILLFTIILAAFASFFLTRLISSPIQKLIQGLQKLESGIYSHRIILENNDDLGKAAKAANSLAESLQRKAIISEMWKKTKSEDKAE